MGKARYQGPMDKLETYESLVDSVEGAERKGAANPYTSRNGHMTSFIDNEGKVSLRLDRDDREEFIREYDTELSVQYGAVMKEFVVMPEDLVDSDEGREWFARSWEWVGTLKPKPTRK